MKGDKNTKRAMEVAAFAGVITLFSPSPGSGKTIPSKGSSILPPLTMKALETTKIHSVAGKRLIILMTVIIRFVRITRFLTYSVGMEVIPTWRISLAHNGVLFLDEMQNLKNGSGSTRQTLEDKVTFPERFGLISCKFYVGGKYESITKWLFS